MQAVSKINFPGWVGVGVVGLYENKANSARPAGAGAGAWLSLAIIGLNCVWLLFEILGEVACKISDP